LTLVCLLSSLTLRAVAPEFVSSGASTRRQLVQNGGIGYPWSAKTGRRFSIPPSPLLVYERRSLHLAFGGNIWYKHNPGPLQPETAGIHLRFILPEAGAV